MCVCLRYETISLLAVSFQLPNNVLQFCMKTKLLYSSSAVLTFFPTCHIDGRNDQPLKYTHRYSHYATKLAGVASQSPIRPFRRSLTVVFITHDVVEPHFLKELSFSKKLSGRIMACLFLLVAGQELRLCGEGGVACCRRTESPFKHPRN